MLSDKELVDINKSILEKAKEYMSGRGWECVVDGITIGVTLDEADAHRKVFQFKRMGWKDIRIIPVWILPREIIDE